MMINKRLIGAVAESKKYIAGNVILQWCSLAANIAMMFGITNLFASLYYGNTSSHTLWATAAVVVLALVIRFLCTTGASRMSYLSSKAVKKTLREKIYEKLLRLGTSYKEQAKTSEVVQVAVEGVDQLETYFGAYLPQFFYAMLAPLTLFAVLCFVNVPAAIVLLVCVPLIPMSIVAVQKFAKKLLDKYWGEYTSLGDDFLENIQGLTTLKIYGADGWKHEQMNEHAERFRKITMRVLTMQLNSVTLMDLLAYGGAALGIISAVAAFAAGQLGLAGCLAIVLLAADFFLPLRLLGSYFHIAMNGAASAEKIFKLLAAPEQPDGTRNLPQAEGVALQVEHLDFAYQPERPILQDVNLNFPAGSFTALVGESGCGKSTVAGILAGSLTPGSGRVTANGMPVTQLTRAARMQAMTLVPHDAKLFKGTVETNLRMAAPNASEPELWAALEEVNLAAFCREQQGLQTPVTENGANLSGGQRQRLGLARALLHNSPVYLFDEATSNIDAESEDDIMSAIRAMRGKRTVILISHRLANVMDCDTIYTFAAGHVVEQGSHAQLLAAGGEYSRLYNAQRALEQYGQKGE